MTKAIVDTTILVDALLKPGQSAERAKKALARYSETSLPVYAIKEFRSGAFSHHVWLHNKLVITTSYAKTLNAIGKLFMQKNKQATALGALERAQASIALQTPLTLGQKYGVTTSIDQIQTDETRLFVKGLIIKAWKNRRSKTTRVIKELPCFEEKEPVLTAQGIYDISPLKCKKGELCCVALDMKKNSIAVEAMRAALKNETKPENEKRRQALKKLQKCKPTQLHEFEDGDCRYLGDAVFSHYCAEDQVILTTNVTDHELLATAIGRTVETTDPEDV